MHRNTLARVRLDGAGWAHPYPVAPWSPIVYADGGGEGEPAPEGAPAPVTPSPTPTPAPAAPAGGDAGQDVNSLPPWAQKQISDLRAEAGRSRTVAKQNAANEARAALVQELAPLLGIESNDDQPPTPEELTAQLRDSQTARTAAQEQAAAAAIELHVYKTAARLGADADALLDSRAFCDAIDDIDGSLPAEEFNTAVQTAITAAMDRNPAYRARPSAGRSGGDMGGAGGSGDQVQSLAKQIEQAKANGDWRTAMRLENTKLAAAEAALQQ